MPAFLQLREQTPKVGRRGTNLRIASATDCSRLDLWAPRLRSVPQTLNL